MSENQKINEAIMANESKKEMSLSIALQALSSVENHDLKMHLIDVMSDLANDQFKKGMSIAEDIWRPRG